MNPFNRAFQAVSLLACTTWVSVAVAEEPFNCGPNPKVNCRLPDARLKADSFSFRVACEGKPTISLEHEVNAVTTTGIECTGTTSENDSDGAALKSTTYTCSVPEKLRGIAQGTLLGKELCGPTRDYRLDLQSSTRSPAAETAASSGAAGARAEGDQEPSDEGMAFLPEAKWQEVMKALRLPIAGARPGNYYDRSGDVAVLFLDAAGDPFYPMLDVIDEDDDIYVVLVDYNDRLANSHVNIQGCHRPPAEPRVFGIVPPEVSTRGLADRPAGFIVRAVGKCAGGEDTAPQAVINYRDKTKSVAIPVNPLYRFAVGVAAAFDTTQQRDFSLNTLPGETVPRVTQTHEHIGLSSLLYISFYPAARDFRKTDWLLWQRTQLFVGLDPRALDKHLVVGLGYELTMGLNLLAGWRVATSQKVLREGSGLTSGSKFDGDARDLPTRNRWETGGAFLGVGLSSSLLSRFR
jgi:hypothetical protein